MSAAGPGRSRLMRRLLCALTALALVLFALKAASTMGWLGHGMFGKSDALRLGAYQGDVGALQWIAQDQGHYNQAGLAAELTGYTSGRDAMEALRAGTVDVATASEYVLATYSFGESDLRVLGSIAYYRNKGIVARRDRGIAAPADLKGKRIAVTSPSGAEYTLNIFLALHGLSPAEVTLVNLPPPQLVEALAAGEVDAAITWQPHVAAIEAKLGAGGITFSGDGFDTYLLLVTRQDKLESGAGAMKKLMRALVQAEEWVQAHPEEAKRYLAARFQLDAAYVEALWPKMPLEVSLPQELLVALDGEARWLARQQGKGTATIPNYAKFMHADELRAAKPSAVTLYSEAKGAAASAVR